MKHLSILIIIISTVSLAYGQTVTAVSKSLARDSIKEIQLEQAALRLPSLRQINISTDVISKGNIISNLNGNPLLKGEASTIRTTALFNVPVKSWGKNTVSTTISYFQQRIKITDVDSFSPLLNNSDRIFNKSTVGITATFIRRDSIFGSPVFLSAGVSGVSNELNSIKKASYLGTAFFPLKQTRTTSYSVGLLINIDPSLKIPVLPLFSYWHKFQNNIELNFTLPSQVNLRKEITNKLTANAGTVLSGSLAFFSPNSTSLPHDANYTTIDLKTGFGLEYRVSRKILFGVNSGLLTPLSARAFGTSKTSSDYFLKNKLSNVPYVNFSFSVLPFL